MNKLVNIEQIAREIGVKKVFLDNFLQDDEMFSTVEIVDGIIYVSIEEAYNFIVGIHFGREIVKQSQQQSIHLDLNDEAIAELNDL